MAFSTEPSEPAGALNSISGMNEATPPVSTHPEVKGGVTVADTATPIENSTAALLGEIAQRTGKLIDADSDAPVEEGGDAEAPLTFSREAIHRATETLVAAIVREVPPLLVQLYGSLDAFNANFTAKIGDPRLPNADKFIEMLSRVVAMKNFELICRIAIEKIEDVQIEDVVKKAVENAVLEAMQSEGKTLTDVLDEDGLWEASAAA